MRFDTQMASKTVLVHFGVYRKVIVFSGELDDLRKAIVDTFSSIQAPSERVLIQRRLEEFQGEWVDVSEIENKAVIQAVTSRQV